MVALASGLFIDIFDQFNVPRVHRPYQLIKLIKVPISPTGKCTFEETRLYNKMFRIKSLINKVVLNLQIPVIHCAYLYGIVCKRAVKIINFFNY